MKIRKRLLAFCLCLAMVFPLSACGSKESSSGEPKKDFVYTAEFQKVAGVDSLDNAVIKDGKMYYSSWYYDEATEESGSRSYIMDLETLESTPVDGKMEENESILQMGVTKEGNLVCLLGQWTENGGNLYTLVVFDESGAEKSRQDVTATLTEGADPEFGVYPQDMAVDPDGNIYLILSGRDEKVVVLNEQGQKQFELNSDGWFQGLCSSGDGRVFAMGYDYTGGSGGYILQHIDVSARAFGDSFKGIPSGNGSTLCADGGENEVYISSGNVLYRYDLSKGTCEELLNWINCDINSDQIRQIALLEDGRILAFTFNWETEDDNLEAVFLKKTPASEVKEKKTLTYGTMYLDSMIRSEIIRFNKSNDTYRIEVKEYAVGGDYETAQKQLNSELTSGNTPDLISLDSLEAGSYMAKGVLADLYPFLDGDSELKREDFIPSVLKLYEQDGKMYGIATSFSIQTLMGKTSDVGDKTGWTVADVQALLASKPAGTELMEYASRESILSMLVMLGADAYVDWGAGTCSFNSDDFIQVLEFANTFPPAESMNYDDSEGTYSKISQGKLLLNSLYMSQVEDYLSQAAMFGEPVTCIGYPTPEGSGTIMQAGMAIGISEKSSNKEGAWEFVRSLLGTEYQDNLQWNFPIRESSLQKVFARAMEEKENGASVIGFDGFTYEAKPATQEEIDTIRRLIDNAKPFASYNTQILTFINEETAAYFAGQKSAKEVADVIQNRVGIYLSENQ